MPHSHNDSFSQKIPPILFKEYITIGERRVSSVLSWSIIAFTLGIIVTTALLASRSGTLEQTKAFDDTLLYEIETIAEEQSARETISELIPRRVLKGRQNHYFLAPAGIPLE
mgnify:CR=1 FL=1